MRFLTPTLVLLWLLTGIRPAAAQSLRVQPMPFSVWLDFDALSKAQPPAVSLPIWLESVQADRPKPQAPGDEQTTFRLRLRRVGELGREIEMRIFFEDLAGVAPVVTGWTETGQERYNSGPLGSGLGLSSSETLIVPAGNIDYLELTVPGRGSTIRGVFLSSVRFTETRFALDFAAPSNFTDPFNQPAPAAQSVDDSYLMGRVKAMLEAGPLKVSSAAPASWDFQLVKQPLLAVLNFEVLNPDLGAPPVVGLNGRVLGPASLQIPDLADPGLQAHEVSASGDAPFHYTGWLHAQMVLPASTLQVGDNELYMVIGAESSAVAVRTIEVQLKYPGVETAKP